MLANLLVFVVAAQGLTVERIGQVQGCQESVRNGSDRLHELQLTGQA